MHKLLQRQLKRHFGAVESMPEEWRGFIDAVNEAYHQAEDERTLLERSLDLTSQELVDRNHQLTQQVMLEQERTRLTEEQCRALLNVVQAVALGNLDVEVEVPEGIKILSELAVGVEMMIGDLRTILSQQEQARAEVEEARQQLETALEEMLSAQRRYLRQEWGSYTAAQASAGYILSASQEGPSTEAWMPAMAAAARQVEVVIESDEQQAMTLALPIHLHGEVIGALGFQREEPEPWGDDELAIVQTVVEQVALALETQRLVDEQQQASVLLGERVGALNLVNDIGRMIDEIPPLAEFLQWVTARIPTAMRYPDDCLVAIEFDGQLYGAAEAIELPCQIVGGLRIGYELMGQVIIAYSELHDFIDEESALLGDIVRRIGGYIENRELFNQMEVRARYQAHIAQAAAVLAEQGTQALPEVLRLLGEAVQASRVHYFETLRDAAGLYWRQMAEWCAPGASPQIDNPDLQHIPTSALPAWSQELRTIGFIQGLTTELPAPRRALLQAQDIQSVLVLAIPGRDNVPGFISFGQVTHEREWSEEEIAILQMAATLLTNAMAREQLFAQVQDALTDLEWRSIELRTAAEVSKAASAILDPDALIQQVVDLVQERFNLYYAGLFLADESGEWTGEPRKWAVLRAGSGKAGQKMIAAGHKLEIGGASMIGSCIADAQARIALDVGAEAKRFDNPYLPHTRSEMALPLIARGQVLGAMTIQDEQAAAFSAESITALQTMADQVAAAIQNGRLYQESIALYLASQEVAQAATVDEALESMAHYVASDLYDFCAVAVFAEPVQHGVDVELEPGQLDELQALAVWEKRPGAAPLSAGTTISRQQFPLLGVLARPEFTNLDDLGQDSRVDPELAQGLVASGVQSALSIPLISGPYWLGLFVAQGLHPTALGPEHKRAFESLANQLAAFIQNMRLLEETRQALGEVQRLHRSYIRESWRDYLLSADESTATAYLLERRQIVPNPDLERPEIDLALEHNHVITINKQQVTALPGSTLTGADEERSTVVVPIRLRGQVIGALGVEDPAGERTWNEDDVALLEAVTTQLGLAIDNARLYEQTQASLAETQTLFETSRSLSAAQEMGEIWQAVVDAARLRGVDTCALLLFDTLERQSARELVSAAGWDREDSPRLPVGTRLPVSLFETLRPDQPLPVANLIQADINIDARNLLTTLGYSALLHQPIAVRGRWFGFLTVLYESPHRFTQAETNFYRTLADQAALAIESQRLLSETQRRAEREQLIRQITEKVRATSNLETILQTTVQELSKAMGLPRAFVRLGTEQKLPAVTKLDPDKSADLKEEYDE